MTRQEKLDALDAKFQPILTTKGAKLEEAQASFNQTLGNYEEKKRKIAEYFDALDAKASAEAVLINGEPTV